MPEGLFGKGRRILRLFHIINDPSRPFPSGHAKQGNALLSGLGDMP
jgi:hypothetical protein